MSDIKRLPGETKDDAKLRVQKEAQAQIEADRRETHEARRKLYTVWLFWKFCPHKQCRRQYACVGDVQRCYNRFWPQVTEHIKVHFRALVTAVSGLLATAMSNSAPSDRPIQLRCMTLTRSGQSSASMSSSSWSA